MITETAEEVQHEYLSPEQKELDAENGIVRKGELIRVDRAYQEFVGDEDRLPQVLPVSQQVIYFTHAKVVNLWYDNRITMLDPAIGAGEFIVKRPVRLVIEGKYVNLHFADIVELDEQTAINLMKARIVDPIDPKAWRP